MKIEELYHELKEYPELIPERSLAEIKAVLKFAKNQGPIFSSIPKNKKASYDEWAEDYTVPISNKPKNDSEQTFSFYSKNDKRDQDPKYMELKIPKILDKLYGHKSNGA